MQEVYRDGRVSESVEVNADELAEKVVVSLAKPNVVEVRIRREPTFSKSERLDERNHTRGKARQRRRVLRLTQNQRRGL